jgi:hypothetical protein
MTDQTTSTPTTSPGFFATLIAWGKQEITTIEGEAVTLWDTIEPELVAEAEAVVSQFLGTAIAAVKSQAALALSGAEKFSNAKDDVIQAIEAAGQTAGNTIVEFVINLALTLFKTSTGASLI